MNHISEQVRESQGELRRGEREIQREIIALQMQEKKLIAEIKAAAKNGNQQVLNVHAKSLVRLRSQIAKLQASAARLKGISSQMTVRSK
jgi:division protein CdvB (Snf7/Vps24/ESCRT-III family)